MDCATISTDLWTPSIPKSCKMGWLVASEIHNLETPQSEHCPSNTNITYTIFCIVCGLWLSCKGIVIYNIVSSWSDIKAQQQIKNCDLCCCSTYFYTARIFLPFLWNGGLIIPHNSHFFRFARHAPMDLWSSAMLGRTWPFSSIKLGCAYIPWKGIWSGRRRHRCLVLVECTDNHCLALIRGGEHWAFW